MKASPPNSGTKLQSGQIRRALLKWHRAYARDLPWRKSRDPYAIWVSEVMLQQTQITTVVPYYVRFLRAFPSIERLAREPFEKVAAQWSGLGYYRRARHLHFAARKLVKEFGGRFPSDYSAARKLPGVGHYTACAVLSIAYNRPLAVLDGNVARVVARLAILPGNLQESEFRQAAERIAQELLSPTEPGLFNQAVMELGQTVCLRRAPRCPACPVRTWCLARRSGRPDSYPQPRPRRPVETWHLAIAVIRKGNRIAVRRGLDDGLLAGLWNFPAAFGNSSQEAFDNLQSKLQREIRSPISWGSPLGALQHRITYRSIRAELYAATLGDSADTASLRWFTLNDLNGAAISQLARKTAGIIRQHKHISSAD